MTSAHRHFARHYIEMLPSMLVAMLLRRDEYSGGAHGHGQVQRVAA